jgi:maltose O-acetyltransferase
MVIAAIFSAIYHRIRGDDIYSQKKNGLQIGKEVFLASDAFLDPGFPWLISIGDECTITSRVIILAHDASTKRHLGYTRIGRVTIGSKTFVGMGSIILPGVTIGNNVIIGAGSIVTRDIPDDSVAVGNPAVVVSSISDYVGRHRQNMATAHVYGYGWTAGTSISEAKKRTMKADLEYENGYVI